MPRQFFVLYLFISIIFATPTSAQEHYGVEPLSQQVQQYLVNGKKAGVIHIYSDSSAQYININELFEILGANIEKNEDATVLNAELNGKLLQINIFTRKIIYGDEENSYPATITRMIGKTVLMDINAINNYLPAKIFWAQSQGILSVRTDYEDPALDGEGDNLYQLPKYSEKQDDTGAKDDRLRTTKTEENEYIPQETEELFLELKIGDLVYDDIIDALAKDGKFYLSLESLINALEFAIDIDSESNDAEGWFIEERNRFKLSWMERQVKSGEINEGFAEEEAILWQDMPYISSKMLEKWFPVSIDISYGQQAINLQPNQLLPFQLKDVREKKRAKWLNSKRNDPDYPLEEQPYQLLTMPFIDFDVDTTYNNNADDALTGNFSAQASGDFLWMNHSTFISGDKEGVSTIRTKLGRYSNDNSLLGPLKLSRFEIGDVDSVDIALVNSSASGRGINISNYPINKPSQFDSTVIEGDITPGWEVEVYSNNTLLAFQLVGEDGKYRFEDIPISYGANVIRTVFYGPNGEIREQQQSYDIADAMLSKGEINYEAAVNEQDVNSFNILEREEKEGNKTVALKAEYGFFDWLTLQAGSVFTEMDEASGVKDEHIYQSIGVVGSGFGIIHNLSAVSDLSKQTQALQYRAATDIFGVSTRIEHIFSDGFYSNRFNSGDQLTETSSSIDFSGDIPFFSTSGLGYRLGLEHETFEGDAYSSRVSNQLSTSILRQGITHTLNFETDETKKEDAMGRFSLRGKFNNASYRFDADYDISPESQLNTINLSLTQPFLEKYNAKLDLQHSFTAEELTTFGGTLTWNQGDFLLSNVVNADTAGDVTVGAKLSVSLYELDDSLYTYSPGLSSQSGIRPMAYLDINQNNRKDKSEEILEDVTFNRDTQAIGRPKSQGPNFIPISAYNPNNISIDDSSFDDPYHYSAIDGVKFIGRPGVTSRLLFPVRESSEVEGFVLVEKPKGIINETEDKQEDIGQLEHAEQKALAGVSLYLLDKKGKRIQKINSEYDGYFVFTKVSTGVYDIVMAPEDMEKLHVYSVPQELHVEETGEIYTIDFIVKADEISAIR